MLTSRRSWTVHKHEYYQEMQPAVFVRIFAHNAFKMCTHSCGSLVLLRDFRGSTSNSARMQKLPFIHRWFKAQSKISIQPIRLIRFSVQKLNWRLKQRFLLKRSCHDLGSVKLHLVTRIQAKGWKNVTGDLDSSEWLLLLRLNAETPPKIPPPVFEHAAIRRPGHSRICIQSIGDASLNVQPTSQLYMPIAFNMYFQAFRCPPQISEEFGSRWLVVWGANRLVHSTAFFKIKSSSILLKLKSYQIQFFCHLQDIKQI